MRTQPKSEVRGQKSETRIPRIGANLCCGWMGHPCPTLKNEYGFWELYFNGQQAVLRCEPGAAYVGWLLAHAPSRPISALELAAQISGATCPCFGSAVFHPDAAAATLFWLRKQKELEALL